MENFQDRRVLTTNNEKDTDEKYVNYSSMDQENELLENNQEDFNHYDSNGTRHLESQDMFNTLPSNENSMEQTEETRSIGFNDSNVACGIYEMGKDCLEVKQEISQKINDINLLKENAHLLKAEIKEKQKLLEKSKVELLTEQDNYDDLQKKLDDEIERITTIGLQQEALNNLIKNLIEQKLRVNQLLDNFNTESCSTKINSDKILYMLEKKAEELKTLLLNANEDKLDVNNKKTNFLFDKQNVEGKLKDKINEMKAMNESQKLKYYQKTAVSDYLKEKGNEEWVKFTEFQAQLNSLEETERQQTSLEEDMYNTLENKEKLINEELFELKQNNELKNSHLQRVMKEKQCLQEQVEQLLQNETNYLQKCKNINNSLATITSETEQLKHNFLAKEYVKDENDKTKHHIVNLEENKLDILKSKNETINSIKEINKICTDLQMKLEEENRKQMVIKDITNNLDSKRLAFLKQFEEIKEQNIEIVKDLENDKSTLNSELVAVDRKIAELIHETESYSETANNKLCEILKSKQQLEANCETTALISNKIEELNQEMVAKQNQFEVEMTVFDKTMQEKLIIKGDYEAEINRRLEIQCKIEYLQGELRDIDSQAKEELKALKDSFIKELQSKQHELESKKTDLDTLLREKKKKVVDLQEDIVDEQKNELHLVKGIQKLTFISDKNKRELLTLKNVIKTLDDKLNTIAQAVTNSIKDKESTIMSQSTEKSCPMGPPNVAHNSKKYSANDDDSSSSGVSMNDNDSAWKKKLIAKQQLKLKNSQTLTQSSLDVNLKEKQTSLSSLPSDNSILKKNTRLQVKTSTKRNK